MSQGSINTFHISLVRKSSDDVRKKFNEFYVKRVFHKRNEQLLLVLN